MMRLAPLAAAAALFGLMACTPPAAQQAPAETAVDPGVTVVINTPTSGARVTSPLRVEGTAPGDWYFEAQFPAKLVGADGAVLAEAPSLAQQDWMTEAPVPFAAELTFSVTQETPATLVLQEDMPADSENPREVTIPVILVPAN